MAGTVEGEMDILEKERAMSRKAIEGYKQQIANQLKSGMGDDIRDKMGKKENCRKNVFLRFLDKVLRKL